MPPPPPPPMMAPAAAAAPLPVAAGGPPRDMLLHSIRQGTKLKKTVTVDKSGPLIAGKVSGADSSRDNTGGPTPPRMNGGPPALGGLFAGGMPRLKPTGLPIAASGSPAKDSPIRLPESRNVNRGPPPQPPPASNKPNFPSSASDTMYNQATESNNGYPSRPVLPNKPPVGGYGKPNVAPKPPPIGPNISSLHQSPSADKPSPPPKKLVVNGRPSVNRAQSMRVPRSPPVAPPSTVTNGPLVNQKGSIHLSQDGLNISKTGTLPHNFHTLKVAPSPPGYRGTPTRPPVTRPPPPPSRPAPPTSAPPPPPHRTSPAPPPPRVPSAAPCSAPPAPPARNSSMRNGNAASLMTELEARFAFHNVREFPDPEPFRNVNKFYNRATAIAKQQAPPPPSVTHLQLSQKMWSSNTSQC